MTGDGTLTAVRGPVPTVAYRLATAEGEILSEYRADEVFTAASTLKLAVLVAAIRAVETGDLSIDRQVPAQSIWTSSYDGSPFGFADLGENDDGWPADGVLLTVGEILERMIVVSSNEATNMVLDLVGMESVAGALRDAGCLNSALGRKYGDLLGARHVEKGQYCSAADLTSLMGAVVAGRLTGPEGTGDIADLLSRQEDRVIGAVVAEVCGDTTPWGSKSGWISKIRHDVAYIGHPGPEALVLAVCTRDFPDHPSAVATIRALARACLSLAKRH